MSEFKAIPAVPAALRPAYRRRRPITPDLSAILALPRISRRSLYPASLVFIAAWLLFSAVDTIWASAMPYLSPARMVVPPLLVLLFIFERKSRSAGVPLAGWITLLAIAGAISSLGAIVPSLGFIKLSVYLAVLIPICLSRSLRDAFAPEAPGFPRLALVGLILLIASGVFISTTASGIYDNSNKLGMLCVCAWPLLMLQVWQPSRWRQAMGWLGLAACVGLCLLAFSRGGFVGLLIGLTAYVALRCSPSLRSLFFALVALAVVGLLVSILNPSIREIVFKGRDSLLGGSRELVASQTLGAWLYRPIFGYGFGLSWAMTPEDAALVFQTGRMSWFSLEFGNSTLAMLSGGGLAVALVVYGMIGHVLLTGIHSLRIEPRNSRNRQQQIVLIAGMLGMLAHAQAEAWLLSPLTWPTLLFWLFISSSAELSARMIPAPAEIATAQTRQFQDARKRPVESQGLAPLSRPEVAQ